MKLNSLSLHFLLLIILFASSPAGRADFRVVKLHDSLVDAEALTIQGGFGQGINGLSFQQDAVASHAGFQYVAYYGGKRRVCLARRKLPAGDWEIIRFEDYDFQSNDAHNIISLGICPNDGTIHLSFDHHGHDLHYRVSKKAVATNPERIEWEAGLFEPIKSEMEAGKPIRITYPRFWQTPQGDLQFCYRRGGSGNGDRMLVDYDSDTGKWVNTRQIDSHRGLFSDETGASKSRCSYPNGYDYGPDGKLHATWVWRESSQGANHDLMYAYSEDNGKTWRNNQGRAFTEPPNVSSAGVTVVEIPRSYGLMNTHGQAVDSQGRIHAVMWHCTAESLKAAGVELGQQRWGPPEARRYHHYWRDRNGEWGHNELPGRAGNRPKLFFDKEDNAYLIFSTKASGARLASGQILHAQGDLRIAAGTAAANWRDWQVIHIEKGPFVNEMLGDPHRWKKEAILSVMVQQSPAKVHEATALRILDFSLSNNR